MELRRSEMVQNIGRKFPMETVETLPARCRRRIPKNALKWALSWWPTFINPEKCRYIEVIVKETWLNENDQILELVVEAIKKLAPLIQRSHYNQSLWAYNYWLCQHK